MKIPLVSVIMPVYNCENFVKEAIDSILEQTFTDFEFIIINDGSTDKSLQIIESFKDHRINLINNRKNLGIVNSLNKGIKNSNGKYLARMDSDDISLPKRLEKQVSFLEKNQDYGLVGSVFGIMDQKRKISRIGPVVFDDEDIKLLLIFNNAFAHGSVLIRKEILFGNKLFYRNDNLYFEDYDLWVRMMPFTKFKNLPELLYLWMRNPKLRKKYDYESIRSGVRNISNRLRKQNELPKINLSWFKEAILKSNQYQNEFKLQGKIFSAPFIETYLYIYYHLALLYLKKGKLWSVFVSIAIILFIKPFIFITHPYKVMREKFSGALSNQ